MIEKNDSKTISIFSTYKFDELSDLIDSNDARLISRSMETYSISAVEYAQAIGREDVVKYYNGRERMNDYVIALSSNIEIRFVMYISCFVIVSMKEKSLDEVIRSMICVRTFYSSRTFSSTLTIEDFLRDTDKYVQEYNYNHMHVFLRKINRFLNLRLKTPFENDVWFTDSYEVNPNRQIPSHWVKEIRFHMCKNERSKELIKHYVFHLLKHTTKRITGVRYICNVLTGLSCHINKAFDEWNTRDIEEVKAILLQKYDNQRTRASTYKVLAHFFDFLELKEYIKVNPVLMTETIKQPVNYHYIETAPPKSIIIQLFNKLDQIPKYLQVWFLIIYCTGVRLCEATSLFRDCIFMEKDICYLRSYQYKMKKEVTNVIPPALYEFILDYRNGLKPGHDYLFPSPVIKGRPLCQTFMCRKFLKEISKLQIIDERTGKAYHFTAHSYRHLMGKRLDELDVPFRFIQEQLHHVSPEMTVVYIEYTRKRILNKMKDHVKRSGRDEILEVDTVLSEDEVFADCIKNGINAQVLPNGLCLRPTKLGRCPKGNRCLSCDEYRTSKEFLPVHLCQIERVKKALDIAVKNNCVKQIEECQKLLNQLYSIVDSLGKEL